MRNIILIGIMGCGKTFVGRELAKKLNMGFCDMDKYIEDTQNISINQIFETYGEKRFREIEAESCRELGRLKNTVISTGGGVVLNEDNITRLKANGTVIYINREISEIAQDIDTSERPLLKNVDVTEKLTRLYEERGSLYKKYADIEVLNNKPIKNMVEEIISEVRGYENFGN